MKGGIFVQYQNKDGDTQKAMAHYEDQKQEYAQVDKVYLRLINEDFSPKMNDGKKVIALKQRTDLKVIGYFD